MKLLTLGAHLSFTASALHAGIAIIGAPAYRYFRAPEGFAAAAEAGSWRPALVTLMLAALFAAWGFYALAASRKNSRLPLMEPALYGITAIYLVRGMFLFPQLLGYNIFNSNGGVTPRDLAFSAIVLAIGLIHIAGAKTRESQSAAAVDSLVVADEVRRNLQPDHMAPPVQQYPEESHRRSSHVVQHDAASATDFVVARTRGAMPRRYGNRFAHH